MNPTDWLNDLISINMLFTQLNNVVDNTAMHITAMDNQIAKLNDNLSKLNANIRVNALPDYQFGYQNSVVNANNTGTETAKKQTLFDKAKPYINASESLGKIADSGIKIYESFAKLPPVLEKVKTGINVFNGAMDVFDGLGTLAESMEAVESIGAISTIMAGAEGVAAATAAFGPVGWAIGGASLLIGGTAAYILSQSDSNDDKENKAGSFADVGQKNGNQSLIAAQQVPKSAEDYIERVQRLDDQVRIPKETEALKNKFLQQSAINFDFMKAQDKDPSYLNGLVAALIENDKRSNKPIQQVFFDSKEDMDAFEKRFDKFHHFPVQVSDPVRVSYPIPKAADGPALTETALLSRKYYNSKNGLHHANVLQDLFNDFKKADLSGFVQSYMTNGFDYVQKEYLQQSNGFQKQPVLLKALAEVWSTFLKVKEDIDHDREPAPVIKGRHNPRVVTAYAPANGKIINIYLNKPMIEQLTINAKEVKEGLGQLKQDVEEVLMEILDSVK